MDEGVNRPTEVDRLQSTLCKLDLGSIFLNFVKMLLHKNPWKDHPRDKFAHLDILYIFGMLGTFMKRQDASLHVVAVVKSLGYLFKFQHGANSRWSGLINDTPNISYNTAIIHFQLVAVANKLYIPLALGICWLWRSVSDCSNASRCCCWCDHCLKNRESQNFELLKLDLDEEKLLGHPSVCCHLLDVLLLLLLHL